ncbi:hypothetical protein CsSME_00015598 [Camellia sinensis var. sinensis]
MRAQKAHTVCQEQTKTGYSVSLRKEVCQLETEENKRERRKRNTHIRKKPMKPNYLKSSMSHGTVFSLCGGVSNNKLFLTFSRDGRIS